MPNNIHPQKIITTKRNIKYVMHKQCLICKSNNLSIDFTNNLIVCSNCNTQYATNIIGIINILEKTDGIIRIYNKDKVLIDDEEKDFEIATKKVKSLIKRKNKTSNR